MKHLRKVMTLVIAAIMALAVSVPALAADPTGTITIKGSEKNTVYDFYRILDLSGQDTSNPADNKYDAITYTLNEKWTAFFTTGAGKDYIVAENSGSLNQINIDGTYKYLNITNNNIVEFTNVAMKYAIDNNISKDATATGDGKDVAVSDLKLGYYLMIPVDASKKTAESSGSVASITSTIPDAEIKVKAVKPSIEKEDDTASADVGQKVNYTITGTLPNTAGYATYKYIVKDEMTDGLTFQKDVKVMLDTQDITSQVTIDYTVDNKFSADIPVIALQGENGANVGKTITITYSAIVNEKAVQKTERNKAILDYGHDPDNLEETTPIEEEVYSTKININKHTGDATEGEKLADAVFVLMNSEGKYYKFTAATETEPAKVEWVTVAGAPTDGTASVTNEMVQALTNNTEITKKTTDANGAAEFAGIKDGTYYLVEIAAPAGYNRLDKPQEVTVEGTNVDDGETYIENHAAAGQTEFDTAVAPTANVLNQSGNELPSTGGMGTRILYTVGGIMLVGGAIALVSKKRAASLEK